jgi:hypothetical protein
MNISPKAKRLLLFIICAAVALLYPFKSTVCPAWTIQVVDNAGNPLKGAWVIQWWQHYTVESSGHRQDAETDKNGYVSFPKRTIRASLLFRTLGVISKTKSGAFGFIHSSFGPDAHIAAYGEIFDGKRFEGSASYRIGQPLPTRLDTDVVELHTK